MTEHQRSEAGRTLQALRKTKSGGRNGGRLRSEACCPCGKMTAKRAALRKHVCNHANDR